MGIKFKDIVAEGDDTGIKVWWILATAALYELGSEFTPSAGIISAILNGEIQLFEKDAKVEGGMPSFKAIIKGDDYYTDRKGSGVANVH